MNQDLHAFKCLIAPLYLLFVCCRLKGGLWEQLKATGLMKQFSPKERLKWTVNYSFAESFKVTTLKLIFSIVIKSATKWIYFQSTGEGSRRKTQIDANGNLCNAYSFTLMTLLRVLSSQAKASSERRKHRCACDSIFSRASFFPQCH